MNERQQLGELRISLIDLERGTTKPLINNIEIIYPDSKEIGLKKGIIDTGGDISFIDVSLAHGLEFIFGSSLQVLEIKIKELFGDEIIRLEVAPMNITHNNKDDERPDILLGRDFLKRCIVEYNGLENAVIIKGYSI